MHRNIEIRMADGECLSFPDTASIAEHFKVTRITVSRWIKGYNKQNNHGIESIQAENCDKHEFEPGIYCFGSATNMFKTKVEMFFEDGHSEKFESQREAAHRIGLTQQEISNFSRVRAKGVVLIKKIKEVT